LRVKTASWLSDGFSSVLAGELIITVAMEANTKIILH